MPRWTLLIALVVLAVPASAQAARFSAEHDVQEMTRLGVEYWAEQGLTSCREFRFEFADDFPEGAYGQAPVGECHGWLDRETFGYPTRSRYTLTMRCTIVVHEIGHGNGLGHVEDGGIMDPFYAEPPRECRAWAKTAVTSTSHARVVLGAHLTRHDGVLR